MWSGNSGGGGRREAGTYTKKIWLFFLWETLAFLMFGNTHTHTQGGERREEGYRQHTHTKKITRINRASSSSFSQLWKLILWAGLPGGPISWPFQTMKSVNKNCTVSSFSMGSGLLFFLTCDKAVSKTWQPCLGGTKKTTLSLRSLCSSSRRV